MVVDIKAPERMEDPRRATKRRSVCSEDAVKASGATVVAPAFCGRSFPRRVERTRGWPDR